MIILIDIKKKGLILQLLEESGTEGRIIQSQNHKYENLTKAQIKSLVSDFLQLCKNPKKVRSRVVIGCFAYEPHLVKTLDLAFKRNRFNNCMRDLPNDLVIFEKHELISLNDFNFEHKVFSLNAGNSSNGNHSLFFSIGNHLQCFEEFVTQGRKVKDLQRVEVGEIGFSPQTDFDYEFIKFVQKKSNTVVKFNDLICKEGFKLMFLFHVKTVRSDIPKEPTSKEIIELIKSQDKQALDAVKNFFRILSFFIYSSVILTLPNKEVVLVGSFLSKMLAAYNNKEELKNIFMDNIVLSSHLKQNFENLKISIYTDIDALVRSAIFQNS